MKKNTTQAPPQEALETRGPVDVAVFDPGLALGDEAGMENITSSDVHLPFLAIAQKTSKAIDRSEVGKFIEGLEFGQMYNSSTGKNYGTGPLQFIPVLMNKRACLKKENGTLGERVEWDDPRVTWEGAKAAGNEKPEGVQIYDWAVVVLPSMDRVVMSFQSTSFGAGKSLNSIVDTERTMARTAGKGFRPYQLICQASTFLDKNEMGSFGKFKIDTAGRVDAQQYDFASRWYEDIKGKTIIVQDQAETEHAEGGARGPIDGQVVDNDKIPF